jgi:uncharacterized pyridoxamine 5'-phosphate oxidase family protein
MNKATSFLKEAKTFYLATEEGGQAHVRPFGAIAEWDDKIYICTNNTKDVFKQLAVNPKFEICACIGFKWLRITGNLVLDSRTEAKAAMLEENPGLKNMYNINDGVFEVLYFEKGIATIYDGGKETFYL